MTPSPNRAAVVHEEAAVLEVDLVEVVVEAEQATRSDKIKSPRRKVFSILQSTLRKKYVLNSMVEGKVSL